MCLTVDIQGTSNNKKVDILDITRGNQESMVSLVMLSVFIMACHRCWLYQELVEV